MFNKLKVLVPFALVAMALTSCGGNGEYKSRIKRVQYNEITGTAEEKGAKSHEVIDSIYRSQTEEEEKNITAIKRRLILPKAGNIDTKIELKFNGLIKYGTKEIKELPYKSTNYKTAWNLGREYMEFTQDGVSSYILKDTNNVYWEATTKNGRKQRVQLEDSFNFADYVRTILKGNATLTLEGVDIGLSGLGYNTEAYVADPDKAPAVGGLFHSSDGEIYKVYEALNKDYNFACTIAKGDDVGAFSGNLIGDFDLKTLTADIVVEFVPEKYREMVKEFLNTDSIAGKINFDVFAAWANNYICQQEYIVNAKDVKYANTIEIEGQPSIDVSVDVKNFNTYFGEEVSLEYEVTDKMIEKVLNDYPVAK